MSTTKPHYHGHRQRLRARFVKAGFAGMAEHEIIELLLTLAIPYRDVKEPAKLCLARFGNLQGILDAPLDELCKIPSLGTVAPVVLRIIREVSNLYFQQKAEKRSSLVEPKRLTESWQIRFRGLKNEVFEVAYLDSSYKLLKDGIERLEEGTIDRAAVYPRRAMEAAIRRGAAVLVFAHNHPNGDVTPSEQDKTLTRALVLAAATLNIKVHDHLIIANEKVFSFSKEGLL